MRLAALAMLAVLAAAPSRAAELRIAAASDLGFVLEEARTAFERERRPRIAVTLGSSGNLYGQIVQGAPFDLFLSADVTYPKKLAQSGLAEEASLSIYGAGRLALWVPHSSSLDLEARGLRALSDPAVRKIALANPAHAPYGRAALSALEHEGMRPIVLPKLVYGESVLQAAQFVQSGAADAGLIALSLARAPAMRRAGRAWEVPRGFHARIDQAGIVLERARGRGTYEAARAFLAFLTSPAGRRILASHGFDPPDARR